MKGWRPWRWVVRRDPAEELNEELGFHFEERVRDYIERGLSPEAARDAAAKRFGDARRVRDACAPVLAADRAAEARRTLWRVSWLDVKLGLRMFFKYPGLSLVSVVAMSVAIAIGAGYFTVLGTWLDATLPLPEGERIISIRTLVNGSSLDDASGEDALQWRDAMKSVTDFGAFRNIGRNITADGRTDVIDVAAMTASGFRLARTAPIMGRSLVDEDERADAPPVVVIGYHEWQRRFGGDPAILQRTIRLDDTTHAIVGVMPQGFGFPVNHQYWVPLRLTPQIPSDQLRVFGHLSEGVSIAEARAEAKALGDRMAVDFPKTHRNRRPIVMPYTHAFVGIQPEMELFIRTVQFGLGLLIMVVAVNVAILVYARTATRMGEIAVRTALGASRARVVSQLFVEALVPSCAAAALGLGILHVALKFIRAAVESENDGAGRLPALTDFHLTPTVILYVTLLAVVAAVIAGVLPALKATGRRVQRGLQQFSARGAGVQLGPTWTALIVLQVAVAVAVLPAALFNGSVAYRQAAQRPAAAAHGLISATLTLSREGRAEGLEKRLPEFIVAVTQRLEKEPGIAAVTFADRFPGQEGFSSLELEGRQDEEIDARRNSVTVNFFDVFDIPVVAGRRFTGADARPDAHAVMVDNTFVRQIGANVVGRRVRYVSYADGERQYSNWFDIVGVVPAFHTEFTSSSGPPSPQGPLPRLFHPVEWGSPRSGTMVIRLSASASPQLEGRLRQIAATVDPGLRVEGIESVVQAWDNGQKFTRLVATAIVVVMTSVLMLSAAGIYAMMSFTVARRRREIGIRAALGADARRILYGIFRRAASQLAAGVALGLTIAATLDWLGDGAITAGNTLVLVPSVVAVMTIVGMAAALVPARRGLAVQPTEALREE